MVAPRFKKAEQLGATKLNGWAEQTDRNTPMAGEVDQTAAGWMLPRTRGVVAAQIPYRAVFDLYDVHVHKLKIAGTGRSRGTPTKKFGRVAGVWKSVTGGTYDFDTAIDMEAIGASGFFYIDIDRENDTLKLEFLEADDPKDDATGSRDYPVLWYIPWDGDRIVRSEIEDWRWTIGLNWPAGA